MNPGFVWYRLNFEFWLKIKQMQVSACTLIMLLLPFSFQTFKDQSHLFMVGLKVVNMALNLAFQLFPTKSRLLTTLDKKAFENIVGKGENAGNQHFLLFPQCFQPYQGHESSF